MTANSLGQLKERFNPKRVYKFGDVTVEVDGVFVRIDEEPFERDSEYVLVPLEDFLQDPAIIRSARVSTGRDTIEVNEKAAGMVGALYKDEHVTPFEGGIMFRLKATAPISVVQPFFQIPYAHNEFSGRYSVIDGPFYVPEFAREDPEVLRIFEEAEMDSQELYKKFLDASMAKEQARFALLFRFFTKFFWTISLRHMLEICALEKNKFAPEEFWETRDNILISIIRDWTPWTYDKFLEHKKLYKTKWAEEEPMEEPRNHIFDSQIENIGSVKLIKSDLDENLMRLGIHTGPSPKRGFGHCSATFEIKCPIFVHRQWVRHRYGSWSELPVDFDEIVNQDDFYVPDRFREQVGKTMGYQYQDMADEKNLAQQKLINLLIARCEKRYWELRNLGLRPDQAALCLLYTFRIKTLWTANVESLMNFFSLRCDLHAQWETRQFANRIYKWFESAAPWANEIFLRYINFGKIED